MSDSSGSSCSSGSTGSSGYKSISGVSGDESLDFGFDTDDDSAAEGTGAIGVTRSDGIVW
eukprot:7366374-Lingulodinium_polyedra.AAC.1